jgi:hypothetical protein
MLTNGLTSIGQEAIVRRREYFAGRCHLPSVEQVAADVIPLYESAKARLVKRGFLRSIA